LEDTEMITKRVLVVDDEPLVARSCRRILSREGIQVETMSSGSLGLESALGGGFDVVLVDLRLPDMDGMEIVRRLRRERPRTAVVVVTGYGSVASAVEATRLGATDYLQKPFTPEEIMNAVDKAMTPPSGKDETVNADQVRAALRLAAEDDAFAARLLRDGSRVLSGMALSSDAKAAIASGDIAWIEKRCGPLTPAERQWLERRLQAEQW
jgi:DNA-binding NtrC family response regulator